MKRFIIILILFSALGQCVSAQVVNVTDNLAGRQSEVKVSVLDSLSMTPLGFASVYLIPDKDSESVSQCPNHIHCRPGLKDHGQTGWD